MSKIIVKTPMT